MLALERTNAFRGRYHVLHGAIPPMDGIGPRTIADPASCSKRVAERDAARPAIRTWRCWSLATNPTLEGEATAMYLAERLGSDVGAVTRNCARHPGRW